MSEKKLNIAEETIQAYLEGKLSAKESHKLEKLALTDQHLSDRLNGAAVQEDLGIDMGAVQASLKSKLANRIEEKKKPIFWLRNLGIAASVLAVLGFSFFVWQNLSSSPELSMVQKTEKVITEEAMIELEESPIESEEKTLNTQQNVIVAKPRIETEAFSIKEKSLEDKELRDEEISSNAPKSKASRLALEPVTEPSSERVQESTPKRVQGNTAQATPPVAAALPAPAAKGISKKSNTKTEALAKVKGQVVDEFNDPLPGVNIQNETLGIAVSTDVNGNFEIPSSSLRDNLTMNYVGFEKKTIKAAEAADKAVELIADQSALSEVVIVAQPKDQMAQPIAGWKVLNEARRLNGNEDGKVKVSFDISSSGTLENVRITKSLNPQSDSEVLEVLNKFGQWKPQISNGKPVKTTRKLSFQFLKNKE